MFDDIIQKKKKWDGNVYAPYIPFLNIKYPEEIIDNWSECIKKEIDEEIVKSIIKEANRG